MNSDQFEQKFSKMLDKFDEQFDSAANYQRIQNDVDNGNPTDDETSKMFKFIQQYENERTNNLIRVALKEFLELSD